MNIAVLYEDNHIIVVIKPANVPSQADASGDEDMLSMVKAYVKEKYAKPGEAFIGLVHRLDRPTAGIMVFARTSKAAGRLAEQMRVNAIKKAYIAMVHGEAPGGQMADYLVKDTKNNVVHVASKTDVNAKKARLYYEAIAEKQNKTLVAIALETGRPHQIRVQFSARDMPLVGDVKYGKGEKPGLALCACYLGFMHPVKKGWMDFFSLPQESVFASFREEIGKISMDRVQTLLENAEMAAT